MGAGTRSESVAATHRRRGGRLSTISDFVTDRVTPALSPAGRTKLFRLPPPVDLAVFRPAPVDELERRRRCISVGRFVPRKGFDVLLTAWRLVLDGWSDPRTWPELTLVGDGPQRAALERRVRRLNLGGQIRFTGALPPSGVARHLQSADVFALPVRTRRAGLEPEGLGLAAIEAAACGLPVVVGRIRGNAGDCPGGPHRLSGRSARPGRLGRAAFFPVGSIAGPRATMGARGRAFVAERFAADRARRQLRAALRLDLVPIRYPGG